MFWTIMEIIGCYVLAGIAIIALQIKLNNIRVRNLRKLGVSAVCVYESAAMLTIKNKILLYVVLTIAILLYPITFVLAEAIQEFEYIRIKRKYNIDENL